MAAGLPLLANDTSYVRTVVSKSKCGLVVDFGREGALVAAVNTLVESHQTRQTMAKAAFIYFDTIFNWEMVSRAMYGNILSMVNELPTEALVVWPTTKTYALYQEGYGRHRDAPSGHEVQVSLHANNSGGSNPLAFPRSNIAFSKKSGIAFRIARVTWHYFPLTMQEKLRPILAQVRARLKRGR